MTGDTVFDERIGVLPHLTMPLFNHVCIPHLRRCAVFFDRLQCWQAPEVLENGDYQPEVRSDLELLLESGILTGLDTPAQRSEDAEVDSLMHLAGEAMSSEARDAMQRVEEEVRLKLHLQRPQLRLRQIGLEARGVELAPPARRALVDRRAHRHDRRIDRDAARGVPHDDL